MTKCLYVVIGAGASFASTSPENVGVSGARGDFDRHVSGSELHPPLVSELFDPRFAGILNKYPIAQMAASDIRRQKKTPVAIEDYLRTRYRDSPDDLDQRKFHAVHWYLQDLLWTVSNYYTSHPDNYDRLLTGCLRLPQVAFITLNYDTLLDDRLRVVSPIDSINAYIDPDRKWSLIKLHGSADWGVPILHVTPDTSIITNPPAKINIERGDIHLRRSQSGAVNDLRLGSHPSQFFYPALSVPVGTRDEFSCPATHIRYLHNLIRTQDRLDVLMLGYSALDEEVLTLFKHGDKRLRSLWVVNADERTAGVTYRRVTNRLGPAMGGPTEAYAGSFESFVGTDDFDSYLALL